MQGSYLGSLVDQVTICVGCIGNGRDYTSGLWRGLRGVADCPLCGCEVVTVVVVVVVVVVVISVVLIFYRVS